MVGVYHMPEGMSTCLCEALVAVFTEFHAVIKIILSIVFTSPTLCLSKHIRVHDNRTFSTAFTGFAKIGMGNLIKNNEVFFIVHDWIVVDVLEARLKLFLVILGWNDNAELDEIDLAGVFHVLAILSHYLLGWHPFGLTLASGFTWNL